MVKIIMLSGGLGNQMFQYAFCLSMRAKGYKCRIDNTLYYAFKMHNGYELLKVFGIEEECPSPSALKKLWIRYLRSRHPRFLVTRDKPYKYCSEVYDSKTPYLMGDWLSYRYFEDIQEEIRQTYTFQHTSPITMDAASDMQSCNSVSLHIRRGDYLMLPNYCVCDDRYYERAIEKIMQYVDNPFFYVFSNDPEWSRNFLKSFGVNYKIIDWNQGGDSYQDMFLMTQCKHNIIANSTFSWWGAWLNQNKNKIVVTPRKWFRNQDLNINCPGWQVINTKKEII